MQVSPQIENYTKILEVTKISLHLYSVCKPNVGFNADSKGNIIFTINNPKRL
jgi:hypothetical protein